MGRDPLALSGSTPAELKARQDVARGGLPYLVLRDSEGRQLIEVLDAARRPRVAIGRRPESDVALPWDERVSRLHAELEHVGGEWVVIDDGLSTNGTWLGDARVQGRRRLHDGDVVRIGDTKIVFCAPAPPVPSTALAADEASAVQISPAQRRVLVALCRPILASSAYAAPPGNAQLAEELYLSVNSVKTHVKALIGAFGLDDLPAGDKRGALVARALQLGVVTVRDTT